MFLEVESSCNIQLILIGTFVLLTEWTEVQVLTRRYCRSFVCLWRDNFWWNFVDRSSVILKLSDLFLGPIGLTWGLKKGIFFLKEEKINIIRYLHNTYSYIIVFLDIILGGKNTHLFILLLSSVKYHKNGEYKSYRYLPT